MGRLRKVDRDTAQAAALRAFWSNGYSGLGVRKLEQVTGINRFTLQTEFGGKKGLFRVLLKGYVSTWYSTFGEDIREGNLDDLAAFFARRTRPKSGSNLNLGCMACNTLADGQPGDPEVRHIISDYFDTIQSVFAAALQNERRQGTLRQDLDIDETSHMLLSALIGINMIIKMNGRNEAAKSPALSLQNTIMGWRSSGE